MADRVKTLANDIMEQCQKQGLTLQEMESLLGLLGLRMGDSKRNAVDKAMKEKAVFKPY